jgi:hypothetical protein
MRAAVLARPYFVNVSRPSHHIRAPPALTGRVVDAKVEADGDIHIAL